MSAPASAAAGAVGDLLAARTEANRSFFEGEAERLARCCHAMAERFAAGGRLIAVGTTPEARSDARHVAVEFVHPVIVGKRALPALAIAPEGGSATVQLEAIAEPGDIVIAYGVDADGGGAARAALEAAAARGCLTIAFAPTPVASWAFDPPSADRFVRQELVETHYHLLWELVHVFFDHRGLLSGRDPGAVHDAGASSFLYPFLAESEHDLDAVLADVAASVRMKAAEIGELRAQTLGDNAGAIAAAAAAVRESQAAGGSLLAFGNGGSATDAMDLVADLRAAGGRAIDLTEDAAILTAIANDIGTDEIFQRQVIAYGRRGDVAIALSTSGNSRNLIAALGEARARGLGTIALVGYDGGRVAAEGLADQVVITRSQHIPRIQEAQASAYHAICELVEREER